MTESIIERKHKFEKGLQKLIEEYLNAPFDFMAVQSLEVKVSVDSQPKIVLNGVLI